MDLSDIVLVQSSFKRTARYGGAAAQTFYAELFRIEPSLRALFREDMSAQHRKLVSALASIVDALEGPDVLIWSARELAHVEFGVKARHYPVVGNALIEMPKYTIGEDFTPQVRGAWARAFKALADQMRRAAYGADTPPLRIYARPRPSVDPGGSPPWSGLRGRRRA